MHEPDHFVHAVIESGLASCTLYLRRRLVIVGAVEILRGAPAWGTSIDIRIHIVGVVILFVAAPTESSPDISEGDARGFPGAATGVAPAAAATSSGSPRAPGGIELAAPALEPPARRSSLEPPS